MKILLVTESYWPNADGGALFERRLVLGLIGRGHSATVIAPSTGWRRYIEQDGPYAIVRERAITFWANTKYKVTFSPFWQVRRVMRRERPDIVHIHNTYLLGTSALWWARRYHIPVIATNHFMPENALLNLRGIDFIYRPLHRLIWAGLVWFHNRCNYVTSPTPTAVALLERYGLHRPAEAISNGVDTAVFHPGLVTAEVRAKYGLPDDRPIVLYVGRVDGEKRIDVIITAFSMLQKQRRAHLVIAGFGKAMDELKAQVTKLGLNNDVTFTGYLDEADKPALYNAASVFTIASPAELQSIVTLEAMASGLPIVAVDVAALKELCHNGENGYLFRHEDSVQLAERLEEILASAKLERAFGEESTKIVQEHHSTIVTFERYEAAYSKAIAAAGGAS